MTSRWRVERAGAPSGYGPGWVAYSGDRGASFATHAQAFRFAERAAWIDLERDQKLGLIKLASRGVRAAGLPSRYVTDAQVRAAIAMRDNGRAWSDIADALDLRVTAIQSAVRDDTQGVA